MELDVHNRFEQYFEDGYYPHRESKRYICGWCGNTVASYVGLNKFLGDPLFDSRYQDTRLCSRCGIATTFCGGGAARAQNESQYPAPRKGENFDLRKARNKGAKQIIDLYNEARNALSQSAPSCAVLMFRKILMHIAVEQGDKPGKTFIQYVNYLKDNRIVGKPQHSLLDRIRDAGNDENHKIRRAKPDEAEDLLKLTTLLINSVYFAS